MENVSELIHWLRDYMLKLTEDSGSSFGKAGVMSELVFESLDEIAKWPDEQQQEAIQTIQRWLQGNEVPEISLHSDERIEESMKLILRAVVDTFGTE